MNNLEENFAILGKYMDISEDASLELLIDLFPDVTENFLTDYERVYNLSNAGSDVERRNRIISAMRQRGGLSKDYFESIGNKLGEGSYTVVITEGSDGLPFIISTYSPTSSPSGPATRVPAQVFDPPFNDTPYHITVTVTGVSDAPDLEKLFLRLQPAWVVLNFVYIP